MKAYCPECLELVPAMYLLAEEGYTLAKHCPDHGVSLALVDPCSYTMLMLERAYRTTEQDDCHMVDVTYRCNAICSYCYSPEGEDRPYGEIWSEILGLPEGCRVLLTGGEPLLHPEILDIVRMVARSGRRPILLTNGRLLTGSMLTDLLEAGLDVVNSSPQIQVSLNLPDTCSSHKETLANLQGMFVDSISFTIDTLPQLLKARRIARFLASQVKSVCIRVGWNGIDSPLAMSKILQALDGHLMCKSSPHGSRSAMMLVDNIVYKVINWPSVAHYDDKRYSGHGVWYRGKNILQGLIEEKVLTLRSRL